jgi:hypothetical protein
LWVFLICTLMSVEDQNTSEACVWVSVAMETYCHWLFIGHYIAVKFFLYNPVLFAICTSTFSKLNKNFYSGL